MIYHSVLNRIPCAVVRPCCLKMKVLVAQSYLILWDPMKCSPSGSSVHGILQQEYWSGLPFPSPGDLPDPGIEPGSSALQADSLPFSHEGSPCHILDSTYIIWYIFHMISYGGWLSLSDLTSFSMIISSCIHVAAIGIVLFFFMASSIDGYLYPLICWWTFGLLSCFDCYE